jgi:propionyl-CoA carboxylase alpha chain
MEAMKMEHSVAAPQGGTVAHVGVAAGDQVDADALLIVVSDD